MKGTLSTQPLAELIREISIKGLSGTLRLKRERAQTAVYFDKGQLIYAASNLRTLRLREYLTKRGLLSQTDDTSRENNLSDLDLAAALTASGTVRQKDIDALLAILVGDVLRVALLWTEGTWDFNPRARLANPANVNVDSAALLREAAQRMSVNFVSQRFRNPTETISRASDLSATSNFLPAESFILSRLDQPLSVRELVLTSGLQELEAYRVIYGLVLSGLIKRQYWQNAFRKDISKTNDEQVEVPVASATPISETQQTDNWLSASVENEELERFLHRLKMATDYYEVIELPPTASASEIKEAYYAMARRYHPDRFHLQSGTRIHADISSAFARVTQAYETLTDPTARSAYDQTLERSRQFWESAPKPSQVEAVDAVDDFEFAPDAAETELGRAEYSFREGFGVGPGRGDVRRGTS